MGWTEPGQQDYSLVKQYTIHRKISYLELDWGLQHPPFILMWEVFKLTIPDRNKANRWAVGPKNVLVVDLCLAKHATLSQQICQVRAGVRHRNMYDLSRARS